MEIRRLPDLTLVNKTKIGENVNARSVLLCAFQGISYVLCGRGDGILIIFQLDKITGEIVDTKEVLLGTHPITLHTFSWENAEYVFAASHRPATIYSSDKKLFINELDLGDVNHMCQLNLAAYPDSIAIATRDKLTIGNIDPTQKHRIRTIPLGEFARCICHQTQTSTYGVCTTQNSEMNFVRLLEAETFKVLSAYQLRALESGESIASCLFTGDNKEYYCVGTKSVLPGGEFPYITKGRLLVFSVENGQLQLIFEKETRSGVSSVKAFNGKLLTGWGSLLELYKWTQRELQPECSSQTISNPKHVQTHGNFIFNADDLGFMKLFVYKPAELELEEQAEFPNHDEFTSASSMRSRIAPLGGLVHSDWRSFYFRYVLDVGKSRPKRSLEDKNFIDGDLIESFLDLSMETKESVANDVGISLKKLCETVVELKRLH
uniref:Uncharacterized protein n=1 Tax=Brassica oleracea TaxID=3712 RepID=A0A3P6AZZ8_BRAOL|nr:unnamed protein product [Brassica oleracea]